MAFLPIGDIDIYYRESGSGPPLILIMGFTANADWWPEEFVEELAKHFRVIAIDNRGAGRTARGRKRFTMDQAAADTIAFMDALGLAKAHVFGISMGGMIAQKMAISYKNRVDCLILGCTMARPATGILSGIPGQAKLLMRYLVDHRARQRPLIVNIMFSQDFLNSNPQIPKAFVSMVSQARITPRSRIHQFVAILKFNALPQLKKIQNPTYIIAGDQDLLIAPIQSHHLAKRLPHAQFSIEKGLGHGFVGEQPLMIAHKIIGFLKMPSSAR